MSQKPNTIPLAYYYTFTPQATLLGQPMATKVGQAPFATLLGISYQALILLMVTTASDGGGPALNPASAFVHMLISIFDGCVEYPLAGAFRSAPS